VGGNIDHDLGRAEVGAGAEVLDPVLDRSTGAGRESPGGDAAPARFRSAGATRAAGAGATRAARADQVQADAGPGDPSGAAQELAPG
jgi:hypothetical protein